MAPTHLLERHAAVLLVARPRAVDDLEEAGIVAEPEGLEVYARADRYHRCHGLSAPRQHPRVLARPPAVFLEARFRDLDGLHCSTSFPAIRTRSRILIPIATITTVGF